MTELELEGVNGTKLYARAWRPDGPPRALVVIVHGFKAHSGLYANTAAELTKRGFAVYALDLRGHGKSSGERYYIDKFSEYVGDVAAFVSLAKAKEPGLPTFMLGHSAGGVIACTYAL